MRPANVRHRHREIISMSVKKKIDIPMSAISTRKRMKQKFYYKRALARNYASKFSGAALTIVVKSATS